LLRSGGRSSGVVGVGRHRVHQRVRIPPGRWVGNSCGIGSGGGSVSARHLGTAPIPEQALEQTLEIVVESEKEGHGALTRLQLMLLVIASAAQSLSWTLDGGWDGTARRVAF
jgi:hypothetical protein